MNRCKNKKGFTLAELMLAVAIIIILGALAMVGVTRYLRSMRLMEMDNAAKELYFAAQNRITAELNSGTLGRLDENKTKTDTDNAKDIDAVEYMVRFPDQVKGKTDSTLWDELLPFGSIDDTIRSSGFYIITYSLDIDANIATVLDVWYTSDDGSGFFRNWDGSEEELRKADYGKLEAARSDRNYRLRFPGGTGNAVIGHYGSAGVTVSRSELAIKEFQLINKEELYLTGTVEKVKGTITLDQVNVNIIVEGRKSGAKKIVTLTPVTNAENATEGYDPNSGKFLFVLDDITTANKRFNKQFSTDADGKKFIPGEDIQVTVEVYSNAELANIDRATAVDNSLFQYVKQSTDETTAEAGIDNFRHLQNLSSEVSGVVLGIKDSTDKTRMGINSAQQTANLVWKKVNSTDPKGFVDFERPVLSGTGTGTGTPIGGDIYYNDSAKTDGSFYPINLKSANDVIPEKSSFMTYRAKPQGRTSVETHKISNLVINDAHAGLFGTVEHDGVSLAEEKHLLTVQNLIMENANITGTTTAGTIVANEESAVWLENISIINATVTASSGNAGGAVGKAVNGLDLWNVSVSESSITANSTTATSGNVGGLLGEHSGTNVHLTISGCSVTNSTTDKPVTGSAAAGGLVGSITNGIPTITNSYSTAIVSGNVAGGLVGTVAECGTGSTISSCYVGGHVIDGTNGRPVYSKEDYNVTGVNVAGGFIGSSSSANLSINNCYTTASAWATNANGVAGGFYGNGAAISILGSYATGLVKGNTAGAFSGTDSVILGSATTYTDADMNFYFELINEGMPGVVVPTETPQPVGIMSVETSTDSYNAFFMLRAPGTFFPYNPTLKQWFKSDVVVNGEVQYRYFLPTVKDLGGDDSMNTHVGDWQPVDTLVFNTAN